MFHRDCESVPKKLLDAFFIDQLFATQKQHAAFTMCDGPSSDTIDFSFSAVGKI